MKSSREIQIAISIFVALQAWKIKDVLAVNYATDPELYYRITLQCFLIDVFYFFVLKIANVHGLHVMKLMYIACRLSLFVEGESSNFFLDMISSKQTSVPRDISTYTPGKGNMIFVADKYCAGYDMYSSMVQPELPTVLEGAPPYVLDYINLKQKWQLRNCGQKRERAH